MLGAKNELLEINIINKLNTIKLFLKIYQPRVRFRGIRDSIKSYQKTFLKTKKTKINKTNKENLTRSKISTSKIVCSCKNCRAKLSSCSLVPFVQSRNFMHFSIPAVLTATK